MDWSWCVGKDLTSFSILPKTELYKLDRSLPKYQDQALAIIAIMYERTHTWVIDQQVVAHLCYVCCKVKYQVMSIVMSSFPEACITHINMMEHGTWNIHGTSRHHKKVEKFWSVMKFWNVPTEHTCSMPCKHKRRNFIKALPETHICWTLAYNVVVATSSWRAVPCLLQLEIQFIKLSTIKYNVLYGIFQDSISHRGVASKLCEVGLSVSTSFNTIQPFKFCLQDHRFKFHNMAVTHGMLIQGRT